MFAHTDKVAVVTGASSGLGVVFAASFAKAEAAVVLVTRRPHELAAASLVRSAGGNALEVLTDVSRPEQCAALANSAMRRFGHVDILVNNAGVGSVCPATHETPD